MKPGRSVLRAGLDGLYLASGWLAGLFLIAILVLMMALSLGREIGMNIPAGDDFTSWCMAAMAFLGLAHTFKAGDMIRVGLVIDKLQGRPRWFFEILSLGIGTAFVGYFAWYAAVMTWQSYAFSDMAQGVVPVPLWIPQLGFSGGLVILFVAFVDELVHVLAGGTPRYEKPPPQTAEEVVQRAIESGV
ncbi:MAG: C4-dicarboxylate transporter permease [Enterovirga sp.]|jgi:TRAP-type C4-dicarboxylate transport system permease small subunit|nr:C4-dicarboxylate transporter permease [Enterovirga sp.]